MEQLINLKMVKVTGGKFEMGSSDTTPIHSVIVNDFYIGVYAITQKQWQIIMGNNPSFYKGCDACPVENISWYDAQEFLNELNKKTGETYRLPTEAEWEYAARGGNKSKGYKYSGSNIIEEVGWFLSNSDNQTHPVGQKQPNELDLYDMSGNVWEWCSDWYDNCLAETQINPKGNETRNLRVLRGGGWGYIDSNCRISYRGSYAPEAHSSDFGFRLVLPCL